MIKLMLGQVNKVSSGEVQRQIVDASVHNESARRSESFFIGEGVNQYLGMLWKHSEQIQITKMPCPFCINNDNEDGGWNFSWGLEHPVTGERIKSCYYTFYPNGGVSCREYPNEIIDVSKVVDVLNLVCIIISDLIQSHDWDKQETIMRLGNVWREVR